MLSLITLPVVYLLGMLFTAALLARPIRRSMGTESAALHAAGVSARRVNRIIAVIAAGFAVLWPITMPLYLLRRFIPASDSEAPTTDLATIERYGSPVK